MKQILESFLPRFAVLALTTLPAVLVLSALTLVSESSRAQTVNDQQAISKNFSVRRAGPFIEILHSKKSVPVIRFKPDDGFISVARAEGAVREVIGANGQPVHGYYPLDTVVEEEIIERYHATQEWKLIQKSTGITIDGVLEGSKSLANYQFTINAISENELSFEVRVSSPEINRVYMKFESPKNEHIYGLGEQYSFSDMKGHRVPLWVMEKGISRGLEPLESFLKLISSMGDPDAEIKTKSEFGTHSYGTYVPIPYFLSNTGRALVLDNTEYSVFDFREDDSATIEVWASQMSGRIFVGETPKDALELYTGYTGRMHPLPDWRVNGFQIGGWGDSEQIRKYVDSALAASEVHGLPITSVNIHGWNGTRKGSFLLAGRLWWTFQHDSTLHPDWEQLIKDLRAKDLRVVTYFNPMVASQAAQLKENYLSSGQRDVYKEAEEAGYFVRKQDGSTYLISSGVVKAGLIDLTNPQAREWMKDLMKDQVKLGVSGWMADFAEALPHDALLFSGEDAAAYHNRYPVEYAKLNHEVIADLGLEDEIHFHSRSGFTHTSRYSTGFFTGDPLNTWDEYGGFKTQVSAFLNAGISGIPFLRYGPGGYWSVIPEKIVPHLPPEKRERIPSEILPLVRAESTPELRARQLEVATFGSYIMTARIGGDQEPSEHWLRFAKMFDELTPYRAKLVSEAAATGIPLARRMMLEFPDDPEIYKLKYQYMYGSEFLISPVVDPRVTKVSAYLPAGKWVHLFTQKTYGKKNAGEWIEMNAPVGEPAVFYKEGSPVGEALVKNLKARGALSTESTAP